LLLLGTAEGVRPVPTLLYAMAGRPALVSKATSRSADDIALDAQAIFGRRRHQPRRPVPPKSSSQQILFGSAL